MKKSQIDGDRIDGKRILGYNRFDSVFRRNRKNIAKLSAMHLNAVRESPLAGTSG